MNPPRSGRLSVPAASPLGSGGRSVIPPLAGVAPSRYSSLSWYGSGKWGHRAAPRKKEDTLSISLCWCGAQQWPRMGPETGSKQVDEHQWSLSHWWIKIPTVEVWFLTPDLAAIEQDLPARLSYFSFQLTKSTVEPSAKQQFSQPRRMKKKSLKKTRRHKAVGISSRQAKRLSQPAGGLPCCRMSLLSQCCPKAPRAEASWCGTGASLPFVGVLETFMWLWKEYAHIRFQESRKQ